jgi:hypothetical protein
MYKVLFTDPVAVITRSSRTEKRGRIILKKKKGAAELDTLVRCW